MSTEQIDDLTHGTTTIDRRDWRVIVRDDDVHVIIEVIALLRSVLPGLDVSRAEALTWRIHTEGAACVWCGPYEPAECYHAQLTHYGLHLAPLEPAD